MVLDVQSFCRAGAVLGVCDLALNFEGILLGRGLATLTQVFIGTGGRFLSVSHQVHDTARRGSSKLHTCNAHMDVPIFRQGPGHRSEFDCLTILR